MDNVTFAQVARGQRLHAAVHRCKVDAVYVSYMNFISTGVQKPEVIQLPAPWDRPDRGEGSATVGGAISTTPRGRWRRGVLVSSRCTTFRPAPGELLDELLPLTMKAAHQCFLDAVASENVAHGEHEVGNGQRGQDDQSLTMKYNRAAVADHHRTIGIMGGVEAMKPEDKRQPLLPRPRRTGVGILRIINGPPSAAIARSPPQSAGIRPRHFSRSLALGFPLVVHSPT
jgi:F0F1-type ATP synthase gamma subunit